jgi:arylsulfatase A-like enzyme
MSLRPFLENPAAASAKPATARGSHGDVRTVRTVRTDRWRLIVRGDGTRPELFDYATDPGETTNHAAVHPEVVESLMMLIR